MANFMRCPKCGQGIDPSSPYCPFCGNQMNVDPETKTNMFINQPPENGVQPINMQPPMNNMYPNQPVNNMPPMNNNMYPNQPMNQPPMNNNMYPNQQMNMQQPMDNNMYGNQPINNNMYDNQQANYQQNTNQNSNNKTLLYVALVFDLIGFFIISPIIFGIVALVLSGMYKGKDKLKTAITIISIINIIFGLITTIIYLLR